MAQLFSSPAPTPQGPGRGPDAHAHDHDHSHGHGHDHDHGHGHSHGAGHRHGPGGHHHHHHAPSGFGARFALGALLNIGFVGAEATYGLIGHSTALLADAGHNLSDVLGLLAAWGASRRASRRPSPRFTYGLGSTSVLAALGNGALLLVVTGMIAAEAVTRLLSPEAPAGQMVMLVAALGMAVNGATAALFAGGAKGDLNVRGAYLHMLSDAAVSAGVVVAGGLILLTHWAWLDPVVSLVISALIVWGTWGLLREALHMALDGVPAGIDSAAVRAWLLGRDGVVELHDLHIWAMSTTETALTCHLVTPRGHPGDAALAAVCEGLRAEFGIGHATLQVEIDTAQACVLDVRHA
jgi:cobalt-zinc-cadmium efflux system protein